MSLEIKTVIKKGTERFKQLEWTVFPLIFVGWLLYDLSWYSLFGGGPENLFLEDTVFAGLLFLTSFTLLLATGSGIVRQYRSDTSFLGSLKYNGPGKMFESSLIFTLGTVIYLVSSTYFELQLLGLIITFLTVLTGLYNIQKLRATFSENHNWIMPKIKQNKDVLRPVVLRTLGLLVLGSIAIGAIVFPVEDSVLKFFVENGLYSLLSLWGICLGIEILDHIN